MSLSKNKKRRIAAWALFLTLTALLYSSAGAQPSVDFIEDDTTLNGDNEIIHYAFVIDDNLGIFYSKTSDTMKRALGRFIEKIKSENPSALISIIENTGVLNTQDTHLRAIDYSDYLDLDYEKQKAEAQLDEIEKASAEELDEKTKQSIKTKKAKKETWLAAIELHKKIEHDSPTIVYIMAHGGGYPYHAGDFSIESSNLAERNNIEFVLLTCMAGNLDLSNTPNIKAFGTGSEHMLSNGIHLTGFLDYLNTKAIPPPTSALEFYEAYETYYNQTPTIIAITADLIKYLLPIDLSEATTQKTYDALATYYINSAPAKAFEALTAWIPCQSSPWFSDLEKQDHRGTKESPWWLLIDSQEYGYLNNILPGTTLTLSLATQTLITVKVLDLVLYLAEIRYLP